MIFDLSFYSNFRGVGVSGHIGTGGAVNNDQFDIGIVLGQDRVERLGYGGAVVTDGGDNGKFHGSHNRRLFPVSYHALGWKRSSLRIATLSPVWASTNSPCR